jgi:hypothetical protein
MFDLFEELRGLVGALAERGVDYAVCGGLALAIHGVARATEDIDLLIRPEDLAAALEIARERGFDMEASRMRFAGGAVEIQRITKLSPQDVLMLDFLLVTPALQDVWTSRVRLPWEDGWIWTLSREGFIRLKTLSGRTKDRLDIEVLREAEDESG